MIGPQSPSVACSPSACLPQGSMSSIPPVSSDVHDGMAQAAEACGDVETSPGG